MLWRRCLYFLFWRRDFEPSAEGWCSYIHEAGAKAEGALERVGSQTVHCGRLARVPGTGSVAQCCLFIYSFTKFCLCNFKLLILLKTDYRTTTCICFTASKDSDAEQAD